MLPHCIRSLGKKFYRHFILQIPDFEIHIQVADGTKISIPVHHSYQHDGLDASTLGITELLVVELVFKDNVSEKMHAAFLGKALLFDPKNPRTRAHELVVLTKKPYHPGTTNITFERNLVVAADHISLLRQNFLTQTTVGIKVAIETGDLHPLGVATFHAFPVFK
jgi:hypothetical protein